MSRLSKSNKNSVDKNSNDKSVKPASVVPPSPVRTQSLSVFEGLEGSPLPPKKPLDLAFDPLTGECLDGTESVAESVDSGRESEVVRKLSSDSSEEGSCSRKSSKSGRRKSSNLGDILESEQFIPEEVVLECFIDPFTGKQILSFIDDVLCAC